MVFVSLVASETGSSTAPHKEAAGARTPAAFGFFLYTPTIDIEPLYPTLAVNAFDPVLIYL